MVDQCNRHDRYDDGSRKEVMEKQGKEMRNEGHAISARGETSDNWGISLQKDHFRCPWRSGKSTCLSIWPEFTYRH